MKRRSVNRKEGQRHFPLILQALLGLQRSVKRLAAFLGEKTDRYPEMQKKRILVCLTVAFVAISSYVMVKGFSGKQKPLFTTTHITTIPLQIAPHERPLLTPGELVTIQRFKNYIDSLSTATGGKVVVDRLLKNRPHLMDTVNFLLRDNDKPQKK